MLSTASDLEAIAQCHKKAFSRSLSSAMGNSYLKIMLGWYLSNSYTFLFHLESKNQIIGYCGGMIKSDKLTSGSASSMIQYSFRAAIKALLLRPWLLLHREMIVKYKLVIKNIWFRIFPNKQSKPVYGHLKESEAGLIVIGIDPKFQGLGMSKIIMEEFERIARIYKVSRLQLTVNTDNSQAINAYLANGWHKESIKSKSLSMFKPLK